MSEWGCDAPPYLVVRALSRCVSSTHGLWAAGPVWCGGGPACPWLGQNKEGLSDRWTAAQSEMPGLAYVNMVGL